MVTSLLSYNEDVVRFRGGRREVFYFGEDPLVRGEMLRQLWHDSQPLDQYYLSGGVFDFGAGRSAPIPHRCGVVGRGMNLTTLKNYVHSDKQGTGFPVTDCVVADLTLAVSGPIDEDARTVGFDVVGDWVVRFERVRAMGNAWCWFDWMPARPYVDFLGCEFFSGRQCISVMASGGVAGTYRLRDCLLDVDCSQAEDTGATSNAVYGGGLAGVLRGGTHEWVNTTVRLRGAQPVNPESHVPRLCVVTDWFEAGPAPSTRIAISGLSIFAVNGPVPPLGCIDFDIRHPEVRANLRTTLIGRDSRAVRLPFPPAGAGIPVVATGEEVGHEGV